MASVSVRLEAREADWEFAPGRTIRGFAYNGIVPRPLSEANVGDTIERWRMVNAANSRFVRLSLGGRPFVVIGTDGGLLAEPIPAAEVLVTPGERVDLAIGPFSEEERLRIEALPYDRGKGETKTE